MKFKQQSFGKLKIALAALCCSLSGFSFAQNIDSLLHAGENEMRRRHYDRAEEIFSYILQKEPQNVGAAYNRGLIRYRLHQYDEAREDFKIVSSHEGEKQDEGYYWVGHIIASKKEDCESALSYYDKAIAIDSTYTDAYLDRAECEIDLKQFDEALADAAKVLALTDNKSYKAYYYKGKAEMEKGEYDKSIASLTAALEIRPRYADPYFTRGTVYLLQAYDKDEAHHHHSLTEALKNYDQFIELNKRSSEAFFDRGEVKMELHDYKGAIADFNKAISLKPDDYDAHTMKAICNYHFGYTEQALKEFDAIIRMDSSYVDAHFNKGIILIDLARYEEAIEEFDQVVKKDPEHADGYEKRGEAKFENGMIDEGCEDFKIAAEMGDEEAQYWLDHTCGKHKKKYKKKSSKDDEKSEEEAN